MVRTHSKSQHVFQPQGLACQETVPVYLASFSLHMFAPNISNMTVLSVDILTFHGTLKQSRIGDFASHGKCIAMLDLHKSDQSVSDQMIPKMGLPEHGIVIWVCTVSSKTT